MRHISVEEKLLIENNRRFIRPQYKFPWQVALKNRNIWGLALAAFCSQWALYFFVAWMPLYLQEGRHFTENEMKFTTSYLFAFGMAGGLLAGFYIDRFVKKRGLRLGRRLISMGAFGIMCILFISIAVTTSNTVVSVCLMCCYFFVPVNGINYFSACVDIGKNNAGTVAGIINFTGSMGAFALSIFFGKIADITNNFNTPLFVIAGVLLIGCLLWLLIDASKELSSVIPGRETNVIFQAN